MGTPVENSFELITYAKDQIFSLQSSYQDSLEHQEISPRVQVQVKNILENLRSALDYLAVHAIKSYGLAKEKNSNQYPISDSMESFKKSENRYIPGLREGHPALFNLIEQSQPYNSGNEWLMVLAKSVNPMKHEDFTPQVKNQVQYLRVSGPSGSVEWDPSRVQFGNGVQIMGHSVDPRIQRPTTTPVSQITYVDWLFADTGESVMGTLEKLLAGVKSIHRALTPHLPQPESKTD